MVSARFLAMLATSGVLVAAVPPMADAYAWRGHLATLQDARIACRDVDSYDCLPYLAQAVAVADTLSDQAKFDLKRPDEFQIPGARSSTWICDTSVYRQFNGEALLHLALAADFTNEDSVYWDNALFTSALLRCRMT